MIKESIQVRIAEIDNEGERKVASLLSDMGFDLVGTHVVRQDYPGPVVGEVDLAFESGNTLLLVEVGTGKNSVSNKMWNFFGKWKDGPVLEALKKQLDRQSYETARVYFDLRPKPENPGGPEAAGIVGPESMNEICYQDDFDRLTEGVKRGDVTKDDFLAGFG